MLNSVHVRLRGILHGGVPPTIPPSVSFLSPNFRPPSLSSTLPSSPLHVSSAPFLPHHNHPLPLLRPISTLAIGLDHCLDHVWRDTILYTESDTPITTGRPYGRADRRLLRDELLARWERERGRREGDGRVGVLGLEVEDGSACLYSMRRPVAV